jgi:hypothetical protein
VLCKEGNAERKDSDISAATGPFEAMRTRQQAIVRYMDLFCVREDCFTPGSVNGQNPIRNRKNTSR